jgi:signal transduction histidine kinase
VLEGLISNAIKYSLQGGSISVCADFPSETAARVSVHDKGIGIDPNRLTIIFKQSTPVKGQPSSRYGGVGISLPLIHEIITKSGGKLWAESQPGQGSTFYFTLLTISEV